MSRIRNTRIFTLTFLGLLLVTLLIPLFVNLNNDINDEKLPIIDLNNRFSQDFGERFFLVFKDHDELNSRITELTNTFGSDVEILQVYKLFPGVLIKINLDNEALKSTCASYQIFPDVKYNLPESENLALSADLSMQEVANIIISRNISFTGAGINISIIDSGIWANADYFGARIIKHASFANTTYGLLDDEGVGDNNGHGTHCAGIAAGSGANSPTGYNMTGIAPGANLFEAKCIDMAGAGTTSSVLAAMEWSVENGAQVLSMSLGFNPSDISPDYMMSLAADNATKRGVVVVVAAGNEGWFYSSTRSPGNARSVITVGAIDSNKQVANFSSRGPTTYRYMDPDVLAPGVNVFSVLAPNTFFEGLSRLMGTTIGDYFTSSGTSMATPVVAGAVALLLDAFPTISPLEIKTALMKTAYEANGSYSQNSQGAGIINITRAYELLEPFNSTGQFNLSAIYPSSIPQAPLDLIHFPGDEELISLMILHSFPDNMSLSVTGNISDFIRFSNTTENETIVNATFCYILNETKQNFVDLNLYIPLTTNVSYYNGSIELRVNSTNVLNASVPINFNITRPISRIYFDIFHNEDRADTNLENYNYVTSWLAESGHDVDFVHELISLSKLRNYDILLLPDIEIPLLGSEIGAITQFYNEGGRIYVLGSHTTLFALESLNYLLSNLTSGILFNFDQIAEYVDVGLLVGYEGIKITNMTNHPITNGVNYINWTTGSSLNISNPAISLMRYEESTVMAISNNTNNGRLIVSGAELHFYNDYFEDEYTKKFINQSFSWILENSSRSDQNNVSMQIIANQSIIDLKDGNETEVILSITNMTSLLGVSGLDLDTELNVTVYNIEEAELIYESNVSILNEIGNGIYNFSLNLSKNGTYSINATLFEGLEIIGQGKSGFLVVNGTPEISRVTINGETRLDEDHAIARVSGNVQINLTISNIENLDVNGVNVSCYVSSVDPTEKNVSFNQYYFENTTSLNSLEANFTLNFTPARYIPFGKYVVIIAVNDSQGYFNYQTYTTYYYLSNSYPVISSAFINGALINSAYPLATLYYGASASISITGTDTEDNMSEMKAFALITSTFLIPGFGYAIYQVVLAAEIPFSGTSFSGSIYIPSNGLTELFGETYNLRSGLYVMILMVRDSDMGWDIDSYAYAQLFLMTHFDPTLVYIFIFVAVVVGSLGAGLLITRRRAQQKYITKEGGMGCSFCGQPLLKGAKFCMSCGKAIERKSSMDDIITGMKKKEDFT